MPARSAPVSTTEPSVQSVSGPVVTYRGATAPGSMGAPVVATDWRLLALHRGKTRDGLCFGVALTSVLKDLNTRGVIGLLETRFEHGNAC